MESKNHMGEYLLEKMQATGRNKSEMVRRLRELDPKFPGTNTSNMERVWTTKNQAMFTIEQMEVVRKAFGDPYIWDEFFENHPAMKNPFATRKAEEKEPMVREPEAPYQVSSGRSRGYRLLIEIDPPDFDPEELYQVSKKIKDALS